MIFVDFSIRILDQIKFNNVIKIAHVVKILYLLTIFPVKVFINKEVFKIGMETTFVVKFLSESSNLPVGYFQ